MCGDISRRKRDAKNTDIPIRNSKTDWITLFIEDI